MQNRRDFLDETTYLEPTPVSDAFVTNVAAAEDMGGCVRVIFCAPQKFPSRETTSAIKTRLVIPMDKLLSIADELRRIAEELCIAPSIVPSNRQN